MSMVNQHFNVYFMSTNIILSCLVGCNTVILAKSCETTIYMPKTEIS